MTKQNSKIKMIHQAAHTKKPEKFIPCDPALNLCRDCGKKITEGTCPKMEEWHKHGSNK